MSITITRLAHVCPDNRKHPRDGREEIVSFASPIAPGSTELTWVAVHNPNEPPLMRNIKFCPHCGEGLPRTLRDARYQAVTVEGGIQ